MKAVDLTVERFAVRLPSGHWVARMLKRFPHVGTAPTLEGATLYPHSAPAEKLAEIWGGEVVPCRISCTVSAAPPRRPDAVNLEE